MTLTTIDIQVPTDRLPAVNGAEATVSAQAKLLPSAPRVHFQPGGEMDVSVSAELAVELAVGGRDRGAARNRGTSALRDRRRAGHGPVGSGQAGA